MALVGVVPGVGASHVLFYATAPAAGVAAPPAGDGESDLGMVNATPGDGLLPLAWKAAHKSFGCLQLLEQIIW